MEPEQEAVQRPEWVLRTTAAITEQALAQRLALERPAMLEQMQGPVVEMPELEALEIMEVPGQERLAARMEPVVQEIPVLEQVQRIRLRLEAVQRKLTARMKIL